MRAQSFDSFGVDHLTTPIGEALLVTDSDGALRGLDWGDHEARLRELLRRYYGAVPLVEARAPKPLRTALTRYFDGDLAQLASIDWRVAGTAFQQKVWHGLQTVRAGTTLSYGALAARIGVPKAIRAVGHANGANPISVVVPCHRLIGADGSLTGYGSGIARKRWLLTHEGVDVT